MNMRKTLFMGVVLAGVAVAASAVAQGGPAGPGYGMGRMGGGMGGCSGSVQQRADYLKAELGITGEQDVAWAAYAAVLDKNAKTIQSDRAGMDPEKIQAMTPEKRQAFMVKMMERHTQLFAELKTAAEALLPSLTDYQKGKASEILPGLASGRGMGGMMGRGMMGR